MSIVWVLVKFVVDEFHAQVNTLYNRSVIIFPRQNGTGVLFAKSRSSPPSSVSYRSNYDYINYINIKLLFIYVYNVNVKMNLHCWPWRWYFHDRQCITLFTVYIVSYTFHEDIAHYNTRRVCTPFIIVIHISTCLIFCTIV